MRILLLGEYSNLHHTLSKGLKKLGHEVTLVSDGDGWKDYPRDIDLRRKGYGPGATLRYGVDLLRILPKLRGYDVVQIINPLFLDLKSKPNLRVFRYLKRHNKKVFLGAFGLDHYWVKTCLDGSTFRYSDFYCGERLIPNPANPRIIREWMESDKKEVNRLIAEECDGIIACLYEYFESYKKEFGDKLTYIPQPIDCSEVEQRPLSGPVDKVKFFIGIQKSRSISKGTDVMYEALRTVYDESPDECEILKAESVPYAEYIRMMNGSHILIDQLYSYTPAMNALIGMAQGLVIAGGAEPEMFELQRETELRPIINLHPEKERICESFRAIIREKERLPELSRQSIAFVNKHHDHVKVAASYVAFWKK